MLTFRSWLAEAESGAGIVYSTPPNDDARYANKGVRSKREGNQPPAVYSKLNPDKMYLGTEDAEDKKQRLRGKKRFSLPK